MSKPKSDNRTTATWIGFLLVFFCFNYLLGAFLNTDGSGSGNFMHYRGPVLPMTSLNGAEGVEVRRNVDFDFSPYESLDQYSNPYATTANGAAGITDTYLLANTTGEARTLELVYGFQGSFIDHSEEIPTITVDGVEIQPELYPSVDSEELLWRASDFEEYSRTLTENDFLASALEKPEEVDIPVTVYHFTELAYEGTEVASYPMLTLQFTVDENTRVWTMIADVLGEDSLMFRVDRGEAWVFTIGGELMDMEFGGNKGYNMNETSAVEGVTFQLETYEATLSEVIWELAQDYDYWAIEGHDYYSDPDRVTPEILADGAMKRFPTENSIVPYGVTQSISGLFNEVITESRMMYLVFPVALQPDQSVTVEAAFIQVPSMDTGGPKQKREGYDMATKLGSDLHFTGLTASLSHTETIGLGKQNFGFDLERGITDVSLDLQVERYYLEVMLRKE